MIAGATHKRSALASDWMPEYIQIVGDIAHTYTKLHGWSEDAWIDKLAYCEIESPYDVDAHVSDAAKPEIFGWLPDCSSVARECEPIPYIKPTFTQAMVDSGELPPVGFECLATSARGVDVGLNSWERGHVAYRSGFYTVFKSGHVEYVFCHTAGQDIKFKPIRTEREIAIGAANEMTLHDLAMQALRGSSTPGIHDTVLLERLAKIDKADKL